MSDYLIGQHKDEFESSDPCDQELILPGLYVKCRKKLNHSGRHYSYLYIDDIKNDHKRIDVYWINIKKEEK